MKTRKKQKSKRPHTLHLGFATLEKLIEFVEELGLNGAALYEADSLDIEVGGRAFPNAYVLRSIVENNKTETQLVATV